MRVLRAAYALLRAKGWLPYWVSDSDRFAAVKRGDSRADGLSLASAIQQAGQASIHSYHARKTLERLTSGNLPAWEQHPFRVWREVEQLIFRGIEIAGGTAPRVGNWRVSSGPWKPAAKKAGVR